MLEVSVVFNAVRCRVLSTKQMGDAYSGYFLASTMKGLKEAVRLFIRACAIRRPMIICAGEVINVIPGIIDLYLHPSDSQLFHLPCFVY